MLTANTLLANGVGAKISVSCKNSIKEGSGVPGFGGEAMMYDGPVHGEFSNGTLTLGGGKLSGANGTFIRNMDDKVTFGTSVNGGFIASDQFGGCDLTILKNSAGGIVGTHVYSNAACRSCVANHPAGWQIVGTWQSNGYAAKWPGNGALLAFAFIEGTQVKVVAVGLKGYPPKINNVELAHTFDI